MDSYKTITKPQGVVVESLSAAIKNNSIAKEFAASFNEVGDGAFVFVPENLNIEKPIIIEHSSNSKNLIVIGENSSACIFEKFESDNGVKSFSNIVVLSGAKLNHYILQNESEDSSHTENIIVNQKKDSQYNCVRIDIGGGDVKNKLSVCFDEEGAQAKLHGLYLPKGNQKIENHTKVEHAVANCSSEELFKGILDDESKGLFHGRVIVSPGANNTKAIQQNKNILLSDRANIETKPELEILADDVKCSHGATVGQIDEDALFYLRSRGIDEKSAQSILCNGFISEILDQITVNEVRRTIETFV